jgi:hypothetical protein
LVSVDPSLPHPWEAERMINQGDGADVEVGCAESPDVLHWNFERR